MAAQFFMPAPEQRLCLVLQSVRCEYYGIHTLGIPPFLAQSLKISKNVSYEKTCKIRLFLAIFNHCVSFVSIADPRFVIQYLSIGKHWASRCLFVIQWHLCYGSFEKYLPKPKFHKSYFEQHLQLCRPGKKRYFQGLLLLSSLYLTVNPRLHKS